MKRITALVLLLVLCAVSFAQGRIPQLDKAKGKRVTFSYTYSLSRSGAAFQDVTSGCVTVEDNAYRLDGLGLNIICNGETRWTADNEARELMIENVEKDNILTNPALLVANYRSYGSQLKVQGGSSDSLDVVYVMDEDASARFVLTDIRYLEPQGKSDFTFDVKSLPDGFIVTDLR